MNKKINGIGASAGIAIAKAYLLKEPVFNLNAVPFSSEAFELELFQKSKKTAVDQLHKIIEIAKVKISKEKAAVFEAHIDLINDVEIADEIQNLIKNNQVSLANAVEEIYSKYHGIFASMDDEYFKERASDIVDVKKRLLAVVLNQPLPDLLSINEECVIVAHDLAPSETAQLNPKFVKGFLTDIGGRTSHAAIMARTLEIPAVVSLKNATATLTSGLMIGLDGSKGEVEVIKTPEQDYVWRKKAHAFLEEKKELEKYKKFDAKTTDGHKILVEGNIGHFNDVRKVIENGAKGIGLFRSEFLYMDSQDWPTENEQFESYKKVLEKVHNHLVIIRTLDIGGDKHLEYYKFPKELNPFLGYRALRLSLGNREMFRTQLRALIRASAFGNLGIMFPMVATVEEFLTAKKLTLELIEEVKKDGHKVADKIQLGMMIEIPTAAVHARIFAKHADFFSIGSNDLIQYSMAVDRMSQEVNYLYQPNFPGLLNVIKLAIDGAHTHNKNIGMCGEMAGELKSIPLLLGMGLDAFSMSASSVPAAKRLISKLALQDCQALAAQALELETEVEVDTLVLDFLNSKNIAI